MLKKKFYLKKVSNIPKPFINFFSLLKYGVVSQVLFFATIPIIFNKYDAENYGMFMIVFSISSVIGAVSALRLERAIVVEKKEQISPILRRCSYLIGIISLLSMILVYYSLTPFDFNHRGKLSLAGLGGLYCMLFGLLQVFIHLAIRQEKIILTGISDLIYVVLLVLLLLIIDTSDFSEVLTLMLIFTGARLISLLPFYKLKAFSYFNSTGDEKINIKQVYKYYLPVFTVLLSNIQSRGLLYLTGIYYGSAVTGNLSMTQQIINAPGTLIGASLRKSFFFEFTKSGKEFEVINSYINKIFKYGSLVSFLIFPIFIVIIYISKQYLPEDWGQIPSYGLALYPIASILVLLSWLDRVYDAKKKQSVALFYEVIYTVTLYLILFSAIYLEVNPLQLVIVFSGIAIIYNLIWAFLTLKLINSHYKSMKYLVLFHLLMYFVVIYILSTNSL